MTATNSTTPATSFMIRSPLWMNVSVARQDAILATMRARFSVLVATLLIGAMASVAAQRRPDFSGTWQIDLDRSKGASPANARVDIIVIKQDAKTMTIEQK